MKAPQSLRGKFVTTMLLVIVLSGVATAILVAALNAQTSARNLTAVGELIEEGIDSKGRVLTENHAIALRTMVLDNAYLDMQRLVERAITEDKDLVYGIYVSSEREALAYCQRGVRCGEKLADREVWRPLGLTEADLDLKALQIRKVQRLGMELLEVAMPVRGEDQELVGTIRYGLSTKRMVDALTSARADADARLRRSLSMIGLIVGLSTLIGVALARMQAVKITRPVSELTNAARTLSGGDRSVRVAIHSGDELEVLGGSFNAMVEDLDASYGKLEELNRTLEQKVLVRTAELATKNRDMRLVLDNVDQGFVTLSPGGVMASERSKVVDEWFGAEHGAATFWDFLAPISASFAITFQLAWSQLEDDILPLDVNIEQLPKRLVDSRRTFSLRYLPFMRDEKLEGVIVVIDDVTERLLKEREEAEHNELMQGFKRLMLDRSGFSNFLREASEMVAEIQGQPGPDLAKLKHTLHTLKGNTATMGLVVVAKLCHALEDQLAESGHMLAATVEELGERWSAITGHVATFIGGEKQRVIEVPVTEYMALVSRLSDDKHREVLDQLLAWQLEPITRPFERLADQARALSRRLYKGNLNIAIEGSGIRTDPATWAPFFSSLVHLIRNAIDHGLESPSERAARGKPESGTITLTARSEAQGLAIEIGDDGRGIDWTAIAARGRSLGLPVTSPDELLAALMHDGVTTKKAVSDVSGRGIGMSAVRERIHEMNGTIEVRSTVNRGTTWIIRFPWDPHVMPGVPVKRGAVPVGRAARAS